MALASYDFNILPCVRNGVNLYKRFLRCFKFPHTIVGAITQSIDKDPCMLIHYDWVDLMN